MLIFYIFVLMIHSKFAFCEPNMDGMMQNAMIYLSKYGYLEPNSMKDNMKENSEVVKKSLMEFQEFAGMKPTGELDEETMKMINMPRCGMKDKISSDQKLGSYVLQGSRWKTRNLKYKITKYPKNLNRGQVDKTIQDAFGLWSRATTLTFEPTTSRAHIDIRFEEGRHGDNDAFDGPGGTLAHAYFPSFGGATHFDDSERWSINSGSGTDLLQVATHEFGHALGLSHSDVRRAIMAPYYTGYIPNLNLFDDDRRAIQQLYGSRNTPGGTPRSGGGGGGGDGTPRRRGGTPAGRTPRRRGPRRRFFPRRFPSSFFPRFNDPVGYIPVYPDEKDNQDPASEQE